MFKKFKLVIRRILRKLPDKLYLMIVYFLTYKRPLNIKNPKFWTEKAQYKKLNDRRKLLTTVADKINLREYAKLKLGIDITPEILWVGKNPRDIPFNQLPDSFIIKTNHGAGTNIIVRNKNTINQKEIIDQLNSWLKKDFYYIEKEWGYKNIDRKVFIEKLLLDETGSIPSDIKLYMFNGGLGAINIHLERFGETHQNILLDKEFNLLESDKEINIDLKSLMPQEFEQMVDYAEKLSSEFDFVRVDFYDLGKNVILGELTHYPVGGFKRMSKNVDKLLGEMWVIPSRYI